MANPTIKLIKPHAGGQRAIYRHGARFHVVSCGRRFGKTEFGKLIVIESLLKHKTDVWWVAPTYKMSSNIWRYFRTMLKPYATWVSGAERVIELPTGNALTIWTANQADTMRGGAPGVVVIDEAAMIPTGAMWQAVIRPALTDKQGRALFLSTPRGRNWFWDLFNRGNDPEFPSYKSWHFPSWYNPALPKGEIEEARRTLPSNFFEQEYAAKFIEDAGEVFRGVTAVSVADIPDKPYQSRFVFGLDWGKKHDFTVISVFDIDKQRQVDLDRFNKVGWALQRGRIKRMYEKWQPLKIYAESNSIGEPNIEALQDEGMPVVSFQTTNASKNEIIQSLSLAIEREDITLLNDRVQIAELQAYQMNTSMSGAFTYSAPDGGHDDTVMATAIAWYGVRNSLGSRLQHARMKVKGW